MSSASLTGSAALPPHASADPTRPSGAEPFSAAFAWRFLRAYWMSPARWPGLAIVAALFALQAFTPWLAYWQNSLNKSFFDALTGSDLAAVTGLITSLALMFLASQLAATLRAYLRDVLLMLWRSWQTGRLLDRWLGRERAFARIERERLVENADQRIAEDTRQALMLSFGLFFGLIGALIGMGTYGGLLWQQSRPVTIPLGEASLTVPHLLFWAAFFYAGLSSLMVHAGGRRLSPTEALQQRLEATFRFLLVRTREHSEQIRFYRGEASESGRLAHAFDGVRSNWWPLLGRRTVVRTIYNVFNALSSLLPTLLMLPLMARGEVTLGDMTQVEWNYIFFVSYLLWFTHAYDELAQWTAAHRRLYTLERALDAGEPAGIERHVDGRDAVTATGLQLARPDGRPLAELGDFTLARGERVLVRGPSGAGKSTFLRALAGLWPHGRGQITVPTAASTMFLPQRSYLPLGSLKAVLSYPSPAEAFDDTACVKVLGCFGLQHLGDRLEEVAPWHQRLSPGEQQRIAAARVLLQRPLFLILDEATSSLDRASGLQVYRTLIERLPGLTLLSVAHDPSIDVFHERVVSLTPIAASAPGAA